MEWVLEQQVEDGNFSNKIFFSDVAHFTLGGYVNKQNSHICGSEHRQVIEEGPLHPEKITVWCALWSVDVIGLYFIENDDGTTVTVNSKHYGRMVTDFFLPAIEEYVLKNMWFQQDGPTCHTTRSNIARDIS